MSGDDDGFNSRNYFTVSIAKIPLPGFNHGHEIIGKITGAIPLSRRAGVVEFLALDDVASVGKSRYGAAIYNSRVPSAMIEMQMRIDNDVDTFRRDAQRRETLGQASEIFKGVDRGLFCVPFIARARFDQDAFACHMNQ